MLAAGAAHAGEWLLAPPITAVDLRLDDETIRVAVKHRLGAKTCEPHTVTPASVAKNIDLVLFAITMNVFG